MREIKLLKNLPVKIWVLWKRQVTWTVICHIKLLPDNFYEKSPSLVVFSFLMKKLLPFKVPAGRILPAPYAPALNMIKSQAFLKESMKLNWNFQRVWGGGMFTLHGGSRNILWMNTFSKEADPLKHYYSYNIY